MPTLVGTQQESVTDFRSNQSEDSEATIMETDIPYSQVDDDNDTEPDITNALIEVWKTMQQTTSSHHPPSSCVRRESPDYEPKKAARQSAPEYKAQKAARDKARRSTEEYKAYLRAYRQSPEYKERLASQRAYRQSPEYKARLAELRPRKAALDKARRSTEEYKLQARLNDKRKAECQRAEEALCPALAEERKKKARPKQAIYYHYNKEKLAARRSTPEMKAKKAAYDKARKEKLRASTEYLACEINQSIN